MVLPGVDDKRVAIPAPPPESMPPSPKRSNRLHNFTLPLLKWGSQRYLRCTKGGGGSASGSGSWDRQSPASWSNDSSASREGESEEPETNQGMSKRLEINGGGDGVGGGIGAMREELILDLKNKANKMRDAFFRTEEDDETEEEDEEEEEDDDEEGEIVGGGSTPSATAEVVKTWNLRARKAESKSTFSGRGGGDEKGLRIDEKKPICSSPAARTDGGSSKLTKLRSNSDRTLLPRQKFSIQLTKKEMEKDFLGLTGGLPRKPTKRPKAVQRQLDVLFPGLWLTEGTADMYKVQEEPVNSKVRHSAGKGKGLMHLAEENSDSS